MSRDSRTPEGEFCTKAGAVLLSHNHLALLHGLMDRPDAMAGSITDWTQSALPYVARLTGYSASTHCILRSLRTFNWLWARRTRHGRCITVQLTSRGRALLDRTVPAHIVGRGPYEGLRVKSRRRK
jgi:hypothetical protein